jgi:bifunctional non-homologous end joining protein LigD
MPPLPLTRARAPFSHFDWVFEVKWDGFRALLYSDSDGVRLGKPQFRDLLFRRAEPVFYAFDLLWDEHAKSDDEEERRRFLNGEDTRYLPLIDRKLRLRAVVPKRGGRLLYCDHVEGDGEGLFRLACERDLEGVVAKHSEPYLSEHAEWLKIRNHEYSQWVGREELFERERREPTSQYWYECALACDSMEVAY